MKLLGTKWGPGLGLSGLKVLGNAISHFQGAWKTVTLRHDGVWGKKGIFWTYKAEKFTGTNKTNSNPKWVQFNFKWKQHRDHKVCGFQGNGLEGLGVGGVMLAEKWRREKKRTVGRRRRKKKKRRRRRKRADVCEKEDCSCIVIRERMDFVGFSAIFLESF